MQLAIFNNDIAVIERYLSLVKGEWVTQIERDKLMINHADLVSDCKKENGEPSTIILDVSGTAYGRSQFKQK